MNSPKEEAEELVKQFGDAIKAIICVDRIIKELPITVRMETLSDVQHINNPKIIYWKQVKSELEMMK